MCVSSAYRDNDDGDDEEIAQIIAVTTIISTKSTISAKETPSSSTSEEAKNKKAIILRDKNDYNDSKELWTTDSNHVSKEELTLRLNCVHKSTLARLLGFSTSNAVTPHEYVPI